MTVEKHHVIAFIEARLDEDAAINDGMTEWLESLQIEFRPRRYDPTDPSVSSAVGEDGIFRVRVPLPADDRRVEAWFVRWDPYRARRLVTIADRVLELHGANEGHVCGTCVAVDDKTGKPWPEKFPCATVRAFTLQWQSHPDFDLAWWPED